MLRYYAELASVGGSGNHAQGGSHQNSFGVLMSDQSSGSQSQAESGFWQWYDDSVASLGDSGAHGMFSGASGHSAPGQRKSGIKPGIAGGGAHGGASGIVGSGRAAVSGVMHGSGEAALSAALRRARADGRTISASDDVVERRRVLLNSSSAGSVDQSLLSVNPGDFNLLGAIKGILPSRY